MGEGAAASGEPGDRHRLGWQQAGPGEQADGRVRGGSDLRRGKRTVVHGDVRQNGDERERHFPGDR